MVWLIGTNRMADVDETEIPSFLDKYLEMTGENHSDISVILRCVRSNRTRQVIWAYVRFRRRKTCGSEHRRSWTPVSIALHLA